MLAKWNPFISNSSQPTNALAPILDSLFQDPFFAELGFTAPSSVASSLQMPHTDILETETEFQLKVDLPGHDPKSIQVKLEGDTLTIQSERTSQGQPKANAYVRNERSHGVFARSFVLPASVDGARCQADYEHGVLTLTMPKREEAKPRAIQVQVRS
jgi:HSP20 family protein